MPLLQGFCLPSICFCRKGWAYMMTLVILYKDCKCETRSKCWVQTWKCFILASCWGEKTQANIRLSHAVSIHGLKLFSTIQCWPRMSACQTNLQLVRVNACLACVNIEAPANLLRWWLTTMMCNQSAGQPGQVPSLLGGWVLWCGSGSQSSLRSQCILSIVADQYRRMVKKIFK